MTWRFLYDERGRVLAGPEAVRPVLADPRHVARVAARVAEGGRRVLADRALHQRRVVAPAVEGELVAPGARAARPRRGAHRREW